MGANPSDLPKIAKNMGFNFRLRRGRVDWRKIEMIDVDQLVQERDLITLYDNLTNVINYNLDNEYDVKVLDPSFVKLFKLAQLSIDYLMFSEQHLCNCLELMQEELRSYLKENEKLKQEVKKKDESIKNMKKKIKDKLAENYFNFQHFSSSCHISGVFKCSYCPKAFMNSFYLEAHHNRRHSSFPYAAPNTNKFSTTSAPHIPQTCTQEIEQMQTEMQELKDIVLHQNRENKENIPELLNIKTPHEESLNEEWREVCDSKMKELELKYKEEISSLKNLLYLEVKNLKEPNHELIQLVNEKDKEISGLRQLLQQKASPPDIELHMETQLAAQENLWMSKFSALEAEYKDSINELQKKLLYTQHMAGTAEEENRQKYENMIQALQSQLSAQDKEIKEQWLLLQQLREGTPQTQTPSVSNPDRFSPKPISSPRTTIHTAKINAWSMSNPTDGDTSSTEHKTSGVLQVPLEKELSYPFTVSTREAASAQELEKKIQHSSLPISVSTSEALKTDETEGLYKNEGSTQMVKSAEQDTLTRPTSSQLREYNSHSQLPVERKESPHKPEPQPERPLHNLMQSLDRREETDEEVGGDEEEVEDEEDEEEEEDEEDEDEEDEVAQEDEGEETDSNRKEKYNTEIANSGSRGPSLPENDTSQWPIQSSLEEMLALNPEILDELREEVSHVLDRRLQELGIDPEWQTLPNASYEQKLQMLQHHQNMTAKRLKTYFRIRDQLLKEVKARLKAAGEKNKINKSESEMKNRSLDNLVNTFRKKARTMLKNATRPHARKSAIPASPARIAAENGKHHSDTTNKRSKTMRIPSIMHRKPQQRKAPMVESDSKLSDSSKSTSSIHSSFISGPNLKAHSLRPSVSEPAINTGSSHTTDWPTTSDDEDETDRRISGKQPSLVPVQLLRPVSDSMQRKPASSPVQKSSLRNASSVGNVSKKRVVFPDNNVHYATEIASESKNMKQIPDSEDIEHEQGSKGRVETDLKKRIQSKQNILDMSSESDWEDDDDQMDSVTEEPHLSQPEAKTINLSTRQSERLAQISKNIEQQLALSRNKPTGGVEAMFSSQSSKDTPCPNQQPEPSRNTAPGSTVAPTYSQKDATKLVPSEWDIEDLSD